MLYNFFLRLVGSFCCQLACILRCHFRLWEGRSVPNYPELFPMMVSNIAHNENAIRCATAEALAEATSLHTSFIKTTLDSLLQLYTDNNDVSIQFATCFSVSYRLPIVGRTFFR